MLILSLCIPTYNRATVLTEALQAIADQWEETFNDLVEIVVSDNASTDQTDSVIEQFSTAHSQIAVVHFRQARNIGGEGNIFTLFKLARGCYVYFLSDDDVLLPGAIKRILDAFAAHPDLDALLLNTRSFQTSPFEDSAPNLSVVCDRQLNDKDEALRLLATYITFVSALAFRRERIADRDYTDRLGTGFPQSYMFVDVLAQADNLFVTSRPYLAMRSDNTSGYNFFELFVTRFAEILQYAEARGFAPTTTQLVLQKHRAFIFNFGLTFKLRGKFGGLVPDYEDGLKRIWRVYRRDPPFLFAMTILLLMPSSWAKTLRRARKQLQGH